MYTQHIHKKQQENTQSKGSVYVLLIHYYHGAEGGPGQHNSERFTVLLYVIME